MTCEQPYCERPLDHDGPCGRTQDEDRSRRSIIEERDALRAEVERLREELGRADDERIYQCGLAQQRLVEVNRLRALIVSVESVEGLCPWCAGPDFTHYPDCSAFSARGEVRR